MNDGTEFPQYPLLIAAVLSIGLAAASITLADEYPPEYETDRSLSGTLHIWGPANMSAISKYWAEGFRRVQPGVTFDVKLLGSDTAIPGLYSGQADLALLGRENNLTDNNGFSRPMQYMPTRFELTTGSLDTPGKSSALVIFVHRDNPINRLTLTQLDAIFGYERRRGHDAIRTWGDLGLTGEWQDQPIRLFNYDIETGTGLFFSKVVLLSSRKLNWDSLREFKHVRRLDGSIYRAGEQSLDALQYERYGMAVSCLCFKTPNVKDLALAAGEGDDYVQATRESLIDRRYPLTRSTYVFIDRPPGAAIEPRTREFLRYLFSRDGQADIGRDGGYLPLNDEILSRQSRLLE